MKKVLHLVLIFGLLTTIFVSGPKVVEATSCSAGEYEVLTATRGAGFSFDSCHSTLEEAEVKMNELPNDIDNTPVVMFNDLIVKMAGGIIDVSDADVLKVINVYETETASSTVIGFNGVYGGEMGYIDSYVIDGSLVRVKGMISGKSGWLKKESYVKLVPTAHLNNNNFFYVSLDVENDVYDLVHTFTHNNLATSRTIGPAPMEPGKMVEGVNYYSFDSIHFYDDYVLMSTDLRNETFENALFTHYNYFQFLSVRTRTNYNAADLNSYLEHLNLNGIEGDSNESALYKTGAHFITAQEEFGVNALLEFAWATHETGYGKSYLALEKNNLFGIGATDDDPEGKADEFSSILECIEYHAKTWISTGYSDPLRDSRYYGSVIGNKATGFNVRYATDPYWGEKMAGYMYSMDKYLGFKDLDYYSLGILNDEVKDVFYNASSVYKTMNSKTGNTILNYPLTITGESISDYKVMMDAPMREYEDQVCTFLSYSDEDKLYLPIDYTTLHPDRYPIGSLAPICDFEYKYQADVSKSGVVIVNNNNYNDPNLIAAENSNIYEISFVDGVMVIKARTIVKGIEMSNDNLHTHKLVLEGLEHSYIFKLVDVDTYATNLEGVDYTFSGYETSSVEGEKIDFTSLEDGNYLVRVQTFDHLGNLISDTKLTDNTFANENAQKIFGVDQIDVIKNFKGDIFLDKSTLEPVLSLSVSGFVFNETNIELTGSVTYTDLDMSLIDNHTKKLLVKNTSNEVVREIALDNVDLGEAVINGRNYLYRGFSGVIDEINMFADGEYHFSISVSDNDGLEVVNYPIKKSDLSFEVADYLHQNVNYSMLDEVNLTLKKLDLDEREIYHYLEVSDLVGNNITFSGYAFMTHIDNEPATISHKLVLKNDDVEYEFALTSKEGPFDLTDVYKHGVDYSKTWFEGVVDISTLPVGDYKAYIKVSTDEYFGVQELRNSYSRPQPKLSNIGSNSLEYYMNKEKFYAIEMSIAPHNTLIDLDKMYEGEPFSYVDSVINVGSKIEVYGFQFIPYVNHDTYNIRMVAIDKNGTTHELTREESLEIYDISKVYKHGVDYGNPWYKFSMDTSILPEGKYVLKTILEVNDLQVSSEVNNYYNKDFSRAIVNDDNTVYIETNTDFRYRLEMNVINN